MKENGNLRCAAESLQSQISIYNQWLLRLPEGMEGEDLAGTQSIRKHRRIHPRNFEVEWRITPRGPRKDTMFWTKSSARALVLGDNYKAAWPKWPNLMKRVCLNWGEKKNMQWASKWGSWSVTAIQIPTKRYVLLSKAFPIIDFSLGGYTHNQAEYRNSDLVSISTHMVMLAWKLLLKTEVIEFRTFA